jgi:nitroreductase
MQVTEALHARHSVRAFAATPVAREHIEALVAAAARTPSWANTQPWEVFVVSGSTLERIREGFAASREAELRPAPEVPRPATWSEAAKARLKELNDTQRAEHPEAFQDFLQLNREFFHAPVVVFLAVDDHFSEWGLYDIGAWSQSFMLAATEQGLGTIPAVQLVIYPQVIRQELDLPDNLRLVIGIALGYADTGHDINNYQSRRSPLSETVRYYD